MKVNSWRKLRLWGIVVSLGIFACGCGESREQGQTPPAASASSAAPAPLVQMKKVADWCQEHGVPESVCTRCNKDLIPGFQQKKDWCQSHGLPESQCIACHPELEAKLKEMAPKEGSGP